jgi:hypothetical protein
MCIFLRTFLGLRRLNTEHFTRLAVDADRLQARMPEMMILRSSFVGERKCDGQFADLQANLPPAQHLRL